MVYKITNHLVDINPGEHLTHIYSVAHEVMLIDRYRQIRANTTIYHNSFFPYSTALWNSLPQTAVMQVTLEDFSLILATEAINST